MPQLQVDTPFNVSIDFELAEFHRRFFAYVIDLMILVVYLFISVYGLLQSFGENDHVETLLTITVMLPALLYSPISEIVFSGQSAGKMAMQLRIISLDGGAPSIGQYLLRWFMRFYEWGFIIFSLFWYNGGLGIMVLFFGGIISIVVMVATKKNQRLGDLVAGTAVISTRNKHSIDDTIFKHISIEQYTVSFPEVMRLSDRDINTIQQVLSQSKKSGHYEMLNRVAIKVQEVLKVPTDLYAEEFLTRVMEDYNYLAATEGGSKRKKT